MDTTNPPCRPTSPQYERAANQYYTVGSVRRQRFSTFVKPQVQTEYGRRFCENSDVRGPICETGHNPETNSVIPAEAGIQKRRAAEDSTHQPPWALACERDAHARSMVRDSVPIWRNTFAGVVPRWPGASGRPAGTCPGRSSSRAGPSPCRRGKGQSAPACTGPACHPSRA